VSRHNGQADQARPTAEVQQSREARKFGQPGSDSGDLMRYS
jgi:hypothetical protein